MSSKKRKLVEIQSLEDKEHISKTKKHKSDSQNIFKHKEDQKQFESILNGINACQLVNKLNIPFVINSEIAQYSTGMVYDCSKYGSDKEIFIIQENFDSDIYNKEFVIFDGHYGDTQHFCKLCTDQVVSCGQCEMEMLIDDTTCNRKWSRAYDKEDEYYCCNCGKCPECGDNLCPCDAKECGTCFTMTCGYDCNQSHHNQHG